MNLKIIHLVMLFASIAAAQLTTVTGTLSGPMGVGNPTANRLTGTLTFKAGATVRAGSWVVPSQMGQTVSVSNGAWTAQLVPTDTAQPQGQYYEVTGDIPRQTPDGRNCDTNPSLLNQGACSVGPSKFGPVYLPVPTSGSPIRFEDYYVNSRPPLNPAISALAPLVFEGASGRFRFDLTASVSPTGRWNLSGGKWRPPDATFASPPAGAQVGDVYLFSDAKAAGKCQGGGSPGTYAQCRKSSTGWDAIGGGGTCGLNPADTWAVLEIGAATCGDVIASMTWALIEQ